MMAVGRKLLWVCAVLASFGMVACSTVWGFDDLTASDSGASDADPDRGSDDTGTSETGTNDSGADDTGTSDGGTDSGFVFDGSAPLTCAAYCANNLGVCTGAPNGQYLDLPTCLAMCAKFPVGDAGNTAGNTLGCRAYHTGMASQSLGLAVTHCPLAGPYGMGVCGAEGENFCTLYNAQCGQGDYGGNCPIPASFGGLNTQDGGGFISATIGNTKNCREYHLEAAYQIDAAAGVGHCLHATKASSAGTCQ